MTWSCASFSSSSRVTTPAEVTGLSVAFEAPVISADAKRERFIDLLIEGNADEKKNGRTAEFVGILIYMNPNFTLS